MGSKEVGHQFLARLGKKRLRPGGIEGTNWLISRGDLSADSKVLDVACNRCVTAIEIAEKYHCSITGIDLDKQMLDRAKEAIKQAQLTQYINVQQANALKLPFEDNSFDIVFNEAMLTMLRGDAKEKAIKEFYRVLKPGGKLLTHDVSYIDYSLTSVLEELRQTINVNVEPLHVNDWISLFEKVGFQNVTEKHGKMTLMSPVGMLKDEGILGTLMILKNGLRPKNRKMFKKMFRFFNKTGKNLQYIVLCSQK